MKRWLSFVLLIGSMLIGGGVAAAPDAQEDGDELFFPEVWEVGELEEEYNYERRYFLYSITMYAMLELADHTGHIDAWYTFEQGEDRTWRLSQVRMERNGNKVYKPQHRAVRRYTKAIMQCRWESSAVHVWDGGEGDAAGFATELYYELGPICFEKYGQAFPPPN